MTRDLGMGVTTDQISEGTLAETLYGRRRVWQPSLPRENIAEGLLARVRDEAARI